MDVEANHLKLKKLLSFLWSILSNTDFFFFLNLRVRVGTQYTVKN